MTTCITPETATQVLANAPMLWPPQPPLDPGPRGVAIRVMVPGSATGYQYACVETALAPKTLGPSPHLHHTLDELSMVLTGTLSVFVDGDVFEVPAGGMQLRPAGLIHTFWNSTDEPVTFADMFFNQNFDEYLEEYFRILDDGDRSPMGHADPAIIQRFADLDERFGVVMFPEQRQGFIDTYGLTG